MSPGIVFDIDTSAWLGSLRTPREKCRGAVKRCKAQGVRILLECQHHGVTAASGGGWHLDQTCLGISMAGALCLAFQGVIESSDLAVDPELAAAEILGTSHMFVTGLLDGLGNEVTTFNVMGAAKALYRAGLDLGHDLRRELTRVCERCDTRHVIGEECPLCAL